MRKFAFGLLFLTACNGSPVEDLNKQLGLENDNIIEEAIEFIIEDQTGLDLDLTPDDSKD